MLNKLKQGQMVEITVIELDDFANEKESTYTAEYRGEDSEPYYHTFHINEDIYMFHEMDIKKIVKK